MNTSDIRAVVFDCFGVIITDALEALRSDLVRTRPDQAQAIEDVITATNRGFLSPEETSNRLADLTGRSSVDVQRAITRDEVKNTELLAYIKSLRGSYKTGLLTNVSRSGLDSRFNRAELDDHFDAAVCSGDIGFAKPEPEAYEIIADRLGVRLAECLMVDDRPVCVDGARAIGMHGLPYTDFARFKKEFTGAADK